MKRLLHSSILLEIVPKNGRVKIFHSSMNWKNLFQFSILLEIGLHPPILNLILIAATLLRSENSSLFNQLEKVIPLFHPFGTTYSSLPFIWNKFFQELNLNSRDFLENSIIHTFGNNSNLPF